MVALVLDHLLVYGVVDRLVRAVSSAVGAEPDDGGRHPGGGTRNAIFAARGDRALELIGPEDADGPAPSWAPRDVRADDGVLWWWAARVDADADLEGVRSALADVGLETTSPEAGERVRPDGGRVAWETVDLVAHPYDTTVPFVIRWTEGTPPWALVRQPACRIEGFRLGHPDAAGLAGLLAGLGLEVPVEETTAPTLSASLVGPSGSMRFEHP